MDNGGVAARLNALALKVVSEGFQCAPRVSAIFRKEAPGFFCL